MRRAAPMRNFRYCLDVACVSSVAIYVIGRWAIRPLHWPGDWLVRDYLNDVLCIPIFLPALLLMHRGLGLRNHDRPPTRFEILFHLAMWSICFEAIAPRISIFHTTADPVDVVAYGAGALVAGWCWGSWKTADSPMHSRGSAFPQTARTGARSTASA